MSRKAPSKLTMLYRSITFYTALFLMLSVIILALYAAWNHPMRALFILTIFSASGYAISTDYEYFDTTRKKIILGMITIISVGGFVLSYYLIW